MASMPVISPMISKVILDGMDELYSNLRMRATLLRNQCGASSWSGKRYDTAILQRLYESELRQPLLALIRGEPFRKVVAELEGYDASGMGEVVSET